MRDIDKFFGGKKSSGKDEEGVCACRGDNFK